MTRHRPRYVVSLLIASFTSSTLLAQQIRTDLPPTALPLTAKLELRIAASKDPAFDIIQVRDLTVDRQGNIFVLDAADQQVKMFNRNGRPVRAFGRKGAGPGEFINAYVISVLRDSLWVIDRQNERLTAFSIAERGNRSVVIPGTGVGLKRVQSVMANGFLCSASELSSFQGIPGQHVNYVVVNNAGAVQNTVLKGLPTLRSLVYTAAQANNPKNSYRGFHRQPFLHPLMVATADDATSLVRVTTLTKSGREIERLGIVKLSARGDTLWRKELSFRGRPLRISDVRNTVDSIARSTTNIRGAILVPNRQMIEDSIFRPTLWPPVQGLVIGVDGTIWLQQGSLSTPKNRYWRLSGDGSYEATVELPTGFVLRGATRHNVWGWRTDGDGLPAIERYRISRP